LLDGFGIEEGYTHGSSNDIFIFSDCVVRISNRHPDNKESPDSVYKSNVNHVLADLCNVSPKLYGIYYLPAGLSYYKHHKLQRKKDDIYLCVYVTEKYSMSLNQYILEAFADADPFEANVTAAHQARPDAARPDATRPTDGRRAAARRDAARPADEKKTINIPDLETRIHSCLSEMHSTLKLICFDLKALNIVVKVEHSQIVDLKFIDWDSDNCSHTEMNMEVGKTEDFIMLSKVVLGSMFHFHYGISLFMNDLNKVNLLHHLRSIFCSNSSYQFYALYYHYILPRLNHDTLTCAQLFNYMVSYIPAAKKMGGPFSVHSSRLAASDPVYTPEKEHATLVRSNIIPKGYIPITLTPEHMYKTRPTSKSKRKKSGGLRRTSRYSRL
jgi:hypothetical protein